MTNLAAPFVKSLTGMAMASLAPSLGPPAVASTNCLSSPPPAIKDELTACLNAFCSTRGLSQDTVDKAMNALEDVAYTTDIMSEVNAERLQDLMSFAEGHAIALRKFAREWCGKVDAKRAHHS